VIRGFTLNTRYVNRISRKSQKVIYCTQISPGEVHETDSRTQLMRTQKYEDLLEELKVDPV